MDDCSLLSAQSPHSWATWAHHSGHLPSVIHTDANQWQATLLWLTTPSAQGLDCSEVQALCIAMGLALRDLGTILELEPDDLTPIHLPLCFQFTVLPGDVVTIEKLVDACSQHFCIVPPQPDTHVLASSSTNDHHPVNVDVQPSTSAMDVYVPNNGNNHPVDAQAPDDDHAMNVVVATDPAELHDPPRHLPPLITPFMVGETREHRLDFLRALSLSAEYQEMVERASPKVHCTLFSSPTVADVCAASFTVHWGLPCATEGGDQVGLLGLHFTPPPEGRSWSK